jgi:thiol-disulfide isomerase/thioredoxin
MKEAVNLARKSYDAYPTAEGAREAGRWLSRSSRDEEAIRHYADAFTIPDSRTRDSERAGDRRRMGELYRKLKGSETGLGDIILEAYDRTTALVAGREAKLREMDPNAQLSNPMEFTLSALQGGKLALNSLKGKVLILDFWATWCGPCRFQHPLYEKVKRQFKGKDAVVFLSVNADDDRSAVKPFVAEAKWAGPIYYEDGMVRALNVTSMPTTIIIGKQGRIVNRMEGFDETRFVDMLTERIKDAISQ